jgi:hypothetical protein
MKNVDLKNVKIVFKNKKTSSNEEFINEMH